MSLVCDVLELARRRLNSISWPSLSATTPPISDGRSSVSSSTIAPVRPSSARPDAGPLLAAQRESARHFHPAHAARHAAEPLELFADLAKEARAAPLRHQEEQREHPAVHLPLEARTIRSRLFVDSAHEPVGQEVARLPVLEQRIARGAQVRFHASRMEDVSEARSKRARA